MRLESLHAREGLSGIQRKGTEGDRVADPRRQGAGDRVAFGVPATRGVLPAESGDAEGGSGRRVSANALGDGERAG